MNLETVPNQSKQLQSLGFAPQRCPVAERGPEIELCEFERLLQRAMEILNARQIAEQLAVKQS